ncbi:MAG TPA: hypothetical protein VFZ01_05405 [Geminicoccaceae bacterium]
MTPEAGRVLAGVERVFDTPRPSWFCNARHCCECAEHEATLQAHTRETLDFQAVGSPAWDPVTFISNPDGFKHLLPALARLAFGRGNAYYLDTFVFQLRHDRILTFTDEQKRALEDLLLHLAVELDDEIRDYDWPEIEWVLRRLRGEAGPATYAGGWAP